MGRYFGTDGIRGQAGVTLTNETVSKVGRYVGYYYKDKGGKVVIGKDTRVSGDTFEKILADEISSQGCDVYLLGYVSTPCLAFTTKNDEFSCGVMISASHNPYTDNGIKIFGKDTLKINDEVEGLIEDYIDNPVELTSDKKGQVIDYKKAIKTYQDWLLKIYPLDLNGKKILVDLCNGSNCYTAKDVLNKLNGKFDYINDAPNGTNINNNCGSTHLEMLKEQVKNNDYEMGFAFDGDADRVLFVDEDGEVVDGDKVMYLLAKYLKDNNQLVNNTLVTTVMSNIGLFKGLEKLGIKSDITSVGDKNVLDSMIKNNFCVGGEQSGHIICSLDSLFGDGLKTALLVLKAMAYYKQTIKQAVSDLEIYPQLLINEKVKDKKIVLNDEDINKKIEEIKNKLGNDGRILVRPSGTEPLIRVMVEAKSDQICHDLVYEVIDLIKSKGYAL